MTFAEKLQARRPGWRSAIASFAYDEGRRHMAEEVLEEMESDDFPWRWALAKTPLERRTLLEWLGGILEEAGVIERSGDV